MVTKRQTTNCGAVVADVFLEGTGAGAFLVSFTLNVVNRYEAVAKHVLGTVQKCDFCTSRLDEGLQPSCVGTCLTGSLIFGNLDDADNDVSRAISGGQVHSRLKEELGTRPYVYYLS